MKSLKISKHIRSLVYSTREFVAERNNCNDAQLALYMKDFEELKKSINNDSDQDLELFVYFAEQVFVCESEYVKTAENAVEHYFQNIRKRTYENELRYFD